MPQLFGPGICGDGPNKKVAHGDSSCRSRWIADKLNQHHEKGDDPTVMGDIPDLLSVKEEVAVAVAAATEWSSLGDIVMVDAEGKTKEL